MKDETKKMIADYAGENGPVYVQREELDLVEADGKDIVLTKGQFNYFLTINLSDHAYRVNVRGVKITDEAPSKFKLTMWEAIRPLPAQNIAKGKRNVFAIAA